VPSVKIEVVDGLTGEPVLQDQTRTGSAIGQQGFFTLAVPRHAFELRLDASGQLRESRAFELSGAGGNLALGNIVLQPGVTVTGTVRDASAQPIDGVDLDFTSLASGQKAYVPDDNTDGLGNFSVVVAAGSYDVEFCPPFATGLTADALMGQDLSASTSLGGITLEPGVLLSGTVTDGVAPVAGADVDLFHPAGGA
jgi:hypothetical protein